jgi:hypothetical protein
VIRDPSAWSCIQCRRPGNLSNYCPACGSPRPWPNPPVISSQPAFVLGVPGRPHRNLKWLWIVVPIATVVSLAFMAVGAYVFYFGYLFDPPPSVLYGTWRATSNVGDYTEEVHFNEDGSYTWTIAGYRRTVWSSPDDHGTRYGENVGVELPSKTISGTWTYQDGWVTLSNGLAVFDPVDSSRQASIDEIGPQDGLILQGGSWGWSLFDFGTFGEGFDMEKVDGGD